MEGRTDSGSGSIVVPRGDEVGWKVAAAGFGEGGLSDVLSFCTPVPNTLTASAAIEMPDSLFTFREAPSVVAFPTSLITCGVDFAKKLVGVLDCCAWFPKILLVDVKEGLSAKMPEPDLDC